MPPRIRTVKPEFFLHEGIFDAEESTGLPLRLAFIGLWCHADREGRFKWRPRALKAGILPYDPAPFADVLQALVECGFVARYTAEGSEYGWIPSFTQHQKVNGRESKSKIPPPPVSPEGIGVSTRASRVNDACPTRAPRDTILHMGKGREGKGREGGVTRRDASPTPPNQLQAGPGDSPTEVMLELRLAFEARFFGATWDPDRERRDNAEAAVAVFIRDHGAVSVSEAFNAWVNADHPHPVPHLWRFVQSFHGRVEGEARKGAPTAAQVQRRKFLVGELEALPEGHEDRDPIREELDRMDRENAGGDR